MSINNYYKFQLQGKFKYELAEIGKELAIAFCHHNRIYKPSINIYISNEKAESCCGWFDHQSREIAIFPSLCSSIAFNPGNRRWSYPGYRVDKEPIGVVAHETGHHIDDIYKLYKGLPRNIERITSYEPNKYESVAETLKVFITNPDLLRIIAPTRYDFLLSKGLKPFITDKWDEVLTSEKHKELIVRNFLSKQ